jgi:branched-chain amino acid transport system substrate-binding protein
MPRPSLNNSRAPCDTANKIGFTSFAQSGYVAANAMIEALNTVKGDYTVESVGAAIQAVSYTTTMLGAPYKFVAFSGTQQPNMTSKMVQIKGGKFVTISDWQVWPPKK